MRIFKSKTFAKFAKREKIENISLLAAVDQLSQGLVDADLGGGLYKQRIARPNEGKSGGYRAIIMFRSEHLALFEFGFAKNDLDNLGKQVIEKYRQASKIVLNLSDEQLGQLMDKGEIEEIKSDGKEKSKERQRRG